MWKEFNLYERVKFKSRGKNEEILSTTPFDKMFGNDSGEDIY